MPLGLQAACRAELVRCGLAMVRVSLALSLLALALLACGPGVPTNGELHVGGTLYKLGTLRSKIGDEAEGWIPLDKLLAVESGDLRADAKLNEMFYFESWALWRFPLDNEPFHTRWSEFVGRARGADFDEGNRNEVGAEIFRQSFEGRMEDLETKWIEWLKKQR